MMTIVTHLTAIAFGIILGGAYVRKEVVKRERLIREIRSLIRAPIDAEFEVVVRRAGGA